MLLNSALELNTLNNRGFRVMKKNVSTSSTLPVNILGKYILNYVNIPLATLHIDINIKKKPHLSTAPEKEKLACWDYASGRLFRLELDQEYSIKES